MTFSDRSAAGKKLAERLMKYAGSPDVVVFGLPRGGVPVAYEVAKRLNVPLDVFVVRKLGAPGQSELAAGAVASGDTVVYNEDVLSALGLSPADLSGILEREKRELRRRELLYRGDGAPVPARGKTVVIVDDGLATGATMKAAVTALGKLSPSRLVVAVPVASRQAVDELSPLADEVVCLGTPEPFWAVGNWYANFKQTEDDEVRDCLARSRHATADPPAIRARSEEVRIRAGDAILNGDLAVPPGAMGLVIFAHGSGSGRFSSRNRFVAGELNAAGFATLLLDLLTEKEEREDVVSAAYRFDIPLLAGRVAAAVDWARSVPGVAKLPIGLFGASTGAAAALIAAAQRPEEIFAVVSRGGRPDLAAAHLGQVRAPTLLLVGGRDAEVIVLNRQAAERLKAKCRVKIVPGATHLFEEPGKLDEVAGLAAEWFAVHAKDASRFIQRPSGPA